MSRPTVQHTGIESHRCPRMPQVAQRERVFHCLLVWALGAKLDTNDCFSAAVF